MNLLPILSATSEAELLQFFSTIVKQQTKQKITLLECGIRVGDAYVKAVAGDVKYYERFTATDKLMNELKDKKKYYKEKT